MSGLLSAYVVGKVDTNQSITKGQVRKMIIFCRQAADIDWYPLYPFGHEYQAILTILFPNCCCANLALAAQVSVMSTLEKANYRRCVV